MTESPRIRPLPEDVAARIAAGEVVERPASVVKELIENSIDAKATSIEVATEAGGKRLIRVADDGQGMSRENALLAIQRHTTSKLSSIEDLDRITTLGFRGEALFAISSVSRFSLVSRREDDPVGVRIWVEGGEVVDVSEAPRQRGTTVEVRDLFYNLPARRRFLRSNNTELGHVVKVVEWYLLTNPQLSISLTNDEREVFTYLPGEWRERVSSHWDVAPEQLEKVELKAPGIRIEGFVTLPPVSFKNRSKMLFSVNGHPVQDSILSAAVREAVGGRLVKGEYPGLLLVITLPPTEVDVNVHPTKREVRFRNGQKVFSAVVKAINQALGETENLSVADWSSTDRPNSLQVSNGCISYLSTGRPHGLDHMAKPGFPKIKRDTPIPLDQNGLLEGAPSSQWAFLSEIEGVYLLFETPDGELVVVDKHACHERMLYERFAKGEIPAVNLFKPVEVELSAEEQEALEAHREAIESLGFNFETAGGRVRLKAVPTWARGREEEIFKEALELRGEGEKREVLARWACRAAVKAGESTSLLDVEALSSWLQAGGEHLTCPHGRPIVVRLTKELLDRLFKRRM